MRLRIVIISNLSLSDFRHYSYDQAGGVHIYIHTHTHIYIYIYVCVCVYIYIYIYIKRARESGGEKLIVIKTILSNQRVHKNWPVEQAKT